ncbi:GNAT family N-acetyltransferase [Streptosporangium sp. DT93]|uniref:GNAT family N-acetyltransferase n=1 Tax=Streptosporangium sp. DT93 TaxID=3393428 RepID=UPI003CED3184
MPPEAARYPSAPLVLGDVSVRPWTRCDAPFLAAAGSLETDPWAPIPLGLSEAQWTAEIETTEARGDLGFVIEITGVDRPAEVAGAAVTDRVTPAGLITLGALDPCHRVAEITGYWVLPALRGRGVAAAAIDLVAGWAMSALDYARIQIFTRPDNPGSRRAARRAGFAEEGVLRSFVEVHGERSDAVVLSRVHTVPRAPASRAHTERNDLRALDDAGQTPAHLR